MEGQFSLCVPERQNHNPVFLPCTYASLCSVSVPVSSTLEGLVSHVIPAALHLVIFSRFHVILANSREGVYGPNDRIATGKQTSPPTIFELLWLCSDK